MAAFNSRSHGRLLWSFFYNAMHTHIVEIALEHSNSQTGKGLKIAQWLPLILGPTEDSYEASSIMRCISTLLRLLRLKLQTGHGIAISKERKKERRNLTSKSEWQSECHCHSCLSHQAHHSVLNLGRRWQSHLTPCEIEPFLADVKSSISCHTLGAIFPLWWSSSYHRCCCCCALQHCCSSRHSASSTKRFANDFPKDFVGNSIPVRDCRMQDIEP